MSTSDLFIKQDIQDALDLEPGFKSKNIIVAPIQDNPEQVLVLAEPTFQPEPKPESVSVLGTVSASVSEAVAVTVNKKKFSNFGHGHGHATLYAHNPKNYCISFTI